MRIKIDNLEDDEYREFVNYILEAGLVKWENTYKKIYEIVSIADVRGNPPIYSDIELQIQEKEILDFPGVSRRDSTEKIRESLKGLIDLLLKED